MPDFEERPDIPFRCASIEDFNERTRHLAVLLGRTPQDVSDLLAVIYGFTDAAALRRDLDEAERSPATHAPGPFEWTADARVGHPIHLTGVRGNHALAAVAAFAGTTVAAMPSHYWDVREMGLFCDADRHRLLFRKVRERLDALNLDGDKRPETDPTPNAYAFPERTGQGEVVLAFTAKGAAIFELLVNIADRHVNDDPDRYLDEVERLLALYPKNPWVGARYVEFVASRLRAAEEQAGGLDVTEARLAERTAAVAAEAIERFEATMGESPGRYPPPRLSSFRGPHGSDSYHYPAILYWGAVAARAAADPDTAERWLSRLLSVDPADEFGARAELDGLRPARRPR